MKCLVSCSPSLRDEYARYIQVESMTSQKPVKAEQVNLGAQCSRFIQTNSRLFDFFALLVPRSVPKASEDTVVAHSPSLSGGLLTFDNVSSSDFFQQYSPFNRSLSNVVAPVKLLDQSWPDFFDINNEQQFPVESGFQFDTIDFFDQCPTGQGLASLFDDYLDFFTMGNAFC